MSARFPAVVVLVFAAFSGSAQQSLWQTNVMTFQDFAQPGTGLSSAGTVVRESGMLLSTLSAEGLANDFVAWRTNDSYGRGSTALANSHSYGTTVLSRTNGAAFDFLGIDLTGFQAFNHGTVTFYGFRGFECVASDSFTYEGGQFQTFRTSTLTNVTEVRWDQNASAVPQFDNVTVAFDPNVPAAQPVVQLRRRDWVLIDIAGLEVGACYALEYADEVDGWIRECTFRSSSTIHFPGFLSANVPAARVYRVRALAEVHPPNILAAGTRQD